MKRIVALSICTFLFAVVSRAAPPNNPSFVLAEGWAYFPTDEPCVAVLGERLQVRNERNLWQVFFITVANEELGYRASYRVDLPPTGVLVGNIAEMTDATSFGFSHVSGPFMLDEYQAGFRSKVLSDEDPPFDSVDSALITGQGTTTSSSESTRSYRALQLQLLESGEAASQYEQLFDPDLFPDSFPNWWISQKGIVSLTENEG